MSDSAAVAVELDRKSCSSAEVLAVGDVAFQLKCLDRIKSFQKREKPCLSSHALQTVEEFCDRALLISNGNIVADGDPADTIFLI